MSMSGLDRGKATEGPANDGLGVAKQDSPWGGQEVAREVDPVGAGEDTPAADMPVAKPAPRPVSPWHHSRPKRPVRPAGRKGAKAPGSMTASGLLQRVGQMARPHISLSSGKAWAPWLGGALVLAWLGATSLHPVGPHEQAIVSTFGASGPTLGPGLAVSWPWPVGNAHVIDVTTVRHLAAPEGDGEHLLLTRDGGLIDLAYDVRWRISDLRRHELGLGDPAATLRLAAETAMRAAVAGRDFSAVIGGRDSLGHGAAQQLQALLDRDHAGIVIDGIDIRRADPPGRVAEAFRAVVVARTEAATEAVQALSYSRQLIVHAQAEAGEFDRIDAQYRLAPDVIRREMYYATMERVLSQSDKVIVDAPGTVTNLPPLPAPNGEAGASVAKAGNGH